MPIRKEGMAPVKRLLRVGTTGAGALSTWMTVPVLVAVTALGILAVAVGSAQRPPLLGEDEEQLAADGEVFGPGTQVAVRFGRSFFFLPSPPPKKRRLFVSPFFFFFFFLIASSVGLA